MKLVNSKQAIQQKEINHQLREIRKQKYIQNAEQKKIFQHLIKNNLELDLKKPQHTKILADGIPQMYRQLVWPQLLKNNHGVTVKLYENLLKKVANMSNQIIEVNRNQELQELQLNKAKSEGYAPSQQINLNLQKISRWFETIKQDIPRTFSELKIFQPVLSQSKIQRMQSPQQQILMNSQSRSLFNMLSCWVLYRQDIGYRQGMSQIAGYLLIQLSNQIKSFQIFCSLMTSDTIYEFFTMNMEYVSAFCQKISVRLRQRNEELYDFFDAYQLDYKLFIIDWVFSLFTKCFQLDTIGKVWDLLLLNGLEEKIIVAVIVEVICAFEKQIYRFNNGDVDSMEICRFLKKIKVDQVRQSQILNNLKQIRN